MAITLRFERNKLMNTNLPLFGLILLLFMAPARAEEAVRGDGASAVNQESNQAQKEKPRSENSEEEFKIRFKKPKQRHDDDEAPVPKIVNPAQVNSPLVSEKKE